MKSIEISVNRRVGWLFVDGIRVGNESWLLDTRKVRIRVRKQCGISQWANDRLDGGCPFVLRQGKHSPYPMPNLQRKFKALMERQTRPMVYEGVYKAFSGLEYAVLKPVNRSSWRALLGMEYFRLFDGAGLHFESPLPVCDGASCSVGDALRLVTVRGALCGFLMPMRPGVSMAELRDRVVKDVGRRGKSNA